MRRIKSKDSGPEQLLVRRLVHGLGYRYRLHARELPGAPDLLFPGLKTVLFVHGCFWHLHPNCKEGRIPATRVEYWRDKLTGNCRRDKKQQRALRALGWKVIVVWECQTKKLEVLAKRLLRQLGG